MKRIMFLIVAMLINAATLMAQNADVKDFLDRYEKLVVSVEAVKTDSVDKERVDSLKAEYKKLTKEVSKHRMEMSNSELEKYYLLKGRYQKKIAIIKTKRGASAVKGWVKGMM